MLALAIASTSGAYAAGLLSNGEVKTRHLADGAVTSQKLDNNAVRAKKVKNFSLRLNDLAAFEGLDTATVSSPIVVAADQCKRVGLRLYNPTPTGLVGSLVLGYLTDADGNAVMNNLGTVVPTTVSETSQNGAYINLVVCAASQQTIPAGSVFHYQVIPPGT